MNQAVESGIVYIPDFITSGSGIQSLHEEIHRFTVSTRRDSYTHKATQKHRGHCANKILSL
jgi:hypothetical protein